MLLFDRVIPVEEMVSRVEKVNLEDIQNAAIKIFASKPSYTLLGSIGDYLPYDELEKQIRL